MTPPVTIDFETLAIEDRPRYPPKPVGVAIWEQGSEPRYMAWGHVAGGNNCTEEAAFHALRLIYDSGKPLLYHNSKFDLEVAEKWFGLPIPNWERVEDTLYLLFLNNPHAKSLSLKPASEELLDTPPDEQSAVRDWLVDHKIARSNERGWGAHIVKAPGDLVGKYAIGDVVRTFKLWEKLRPSLDEGMVQAYKRERRLMPVLLRNEQQGIRVDRENLERDIPIFQAAMGKTDEWLRARLSTKELNLDADADVAKALKAAGVVEEFSKTKTGKDSVSKKNLTVDRFLDPQVASALGYRNRLQTVLSMSMLPWFEDSSSDGRIRTEWSQVRSSDERGANFAGTRTGRLSCSRIQNITKNFLDKNDGYEHPSFLEVPQLPLVRKYIVPDDETCLIGHADFSQQELRILANYEDGALCKAYQDNPRLDVHSFNQSRLAKEAGVEVERRQIKILVFAMVYGAGKRGIAKQLGVDEGTAEKFINGFRRGLPGVAMLEKDIKRRFRSGQPIRTWGGRLYFCEPPREIEGTMRTFDYKGLNYLIQGSASDWTKEALVRYDAAKVHGRLISTVHDEINISVPKEHLAEEMEILRVAMEEIPGLDVPMLSDAKTGPTWGDLEKYEVTNAKAA